MPAPHVECTALPCASVPNFWPHTPHHHTCQGEYYACALSNIYTFGPTFRAEYSFTARHLAEFWMIEPEMAFCDIYDDMQCAEDYVRYCCKFILDNCRWAHGESPDVWCGVRGQGSVAVCVDDMQCAKDYVRYSCKFPLDAPSLLSPAHSAPPPRSDLEFITKMIDKGAIERLEQVANTPFKRCSYTEAIELLQKAVVNGKKFEYPVEWGIDLATEHERHLSEEIFKQPVSVD